MNAKMQAFVLGFVNLFLRYGAHVGVLSALQREALDKIGELRGMYTGAEYAAACVECFGGKVDGKNTKGELRATLEAATDKDGKPASFIGKARENETENQAAQRARLNKFLSDVRIIAVAARSPKFDLSRSFNACYVAAKGTGSNRSGTAKKKAAKAAAISAKDLEAYIVKHAHSNNNEEILAVYSALTRLIKGRKDCALKLTALNAHIADLKAAA